MEVAGGFGPLAGKALRIGTMGYSSTAENLEMILGGAEGRARAAVEDARDLAIIGIARLPILCRALVGHPHVPSHAKCESVQARPNG
jgi:hypothetical protein